MGCSCFWDAAEVEKGCRAATLRLHGSALQLSAPKVRPKGSTHASDAPAILSATHRACARTHRAASLLPRTPEAPGARPATLVASRNSLDIEVRCDWAGGLPALGTRRSPLTENRPPLACRALV